MKTKPLILIMAFAFALSIIGFSSALHAARTKQTARKSKGTQPQQTTTTTNTNE